MGVLALFATLGHSRQHALRMMMVVVSMMVQANAHSLKAKLCSRKLSICRFASLRVPPDRNVLDFVRAGSNAMWSTGCQAREHLHLPAYGNWPRRLNQMTDYRVNPGEAREDQVTAAIEHYTSQLPSSSYLGLALASMVASLTFKFAKKDNAALFVGQWAAPFLLMGIYNKMVKQHGSDASNQRGPS
jgi:hypothetical protein